MTRNKFLSTGTASAIDSQIDKVFRGLGSPKPPLVIEDVIELLSLDRQFYTTSSDGIFRETCSRIKVGIIQAFKRPSILMDVVKKMSLRALYVPDRKRILIDREAVPDLKIRWVTSHEITHHLCSEWHGDVLFGDDAVTISQDCHEQIEREANYGAGRLLTFQEQFKEHLTGNAHDFKLVEKLKKLYGNSYNSTLWRTVESSPLACFAIIGEHPRHGTGELCKYLVESRCFKLGYPEFKIDDVLKSMLEYCKYTKTGPMGKGEVTMLDIHGNKNAFSLETFSTKYDTMTIGVFQRRIPFMIALAPSL